MNLTTTKLKKIIREETQNVLKLNEAYEEAFRNLGERGNVDWLAWAIAQWAKDSGYNNEDRTFDLPSMVLEDREFAEKGGSVGQAGTSPNDSSLYRILTTAFQSNGVKEEAAQKYAMDSLHSNNIRAITSRINATGAFILFGWPEFYLVGSKAAKEGEGGKAMNYVFLGTKEEAMANEVSNFAVRPQRRAGGL